MARMRTIKPETWSDEKFSELSMAARLLFIASWNFADDYGGLDRSAKQLKAQAFPYDVIDCEPLIQELLKLGVFIEYSVNGKNYLHINNFNKHQKIDNQNKHPRVPKYEDYLKTRSVLDEVSVRNRGGLGESSVSPREDSASAPRGLHEGSPSPRPSFLILESSLNSSSFLNSSLNLKSLEEKSRDSNLGTVDPKQANENGSQVVEHERSTGYYATSDDPYPVSRGTVTQDEVYQTIAMMKAKYPRGGRETWMTAEHHIGRLLDTGEATCQQLEDGVERYAKWCRKSGTMPMNPAKFFSDIDRPWSQLWLSHEAAKRETSVDRIKRARREAEEKLNGSSYVAADESPSGDSVGHARELTRS